MLFKTLHGSHLYGLAHDGSDRDYYVVLETQSKKKARYAKQSIVDGIDTTTVDFGTWVNMCQSGVPQAIEAMFSPMAEVDQISEFRNAFRVGDGIRDKYYRTIDNFLQEESDFKRRRHGFRLALNLRTALRHGRFNPTLTKKEAIWVTYQAKQDDLEHMREIAFNLANA